MNQKPYVILDRDGTIIFERHYLSDPALVELLPNAAAGMRSLARMGFGLVIITNQSGIGRGFFDEVRLNEIHQRLKALLAAEGVSVDGIYYCPHTPSDRCHCRKPQIGLIETAAKEFNFSPSDCFVIGDKPCDIELGENSGSKTILVKTGYGSEFAASGMLTPNYIVDDLLAAAQVIGQHIQIAAQDGGQNQTSLTEIRTQYNCHQ